MPDVAQVVVDPNGLSSAVLVGRDGTTRGPSRTSLADALEWACRAARRVTVRDDGWDRETDPEDEFADLLAEPAAWHSAGDERVAGLPLWPPPGYEPPVVPRATTEVSDRWVARIAAGADAEDHPRMTDALLRALPGSTRVPHPAGVAVEVELPGGTVADACAAADAAEDRCRAALARDPDAGFDHVLAGWDLRPGAPVRRDGPSRVFLEQDVWDVPVDGFHVVFSNLADYRVAEDMPAARRYDDRVRWAASVADEVWVRTAGTRFRPAADGRPVLPDPVVPERFDPPVPWRVALAVSVDGSGGHVAGIAALRERFGAAICADATLDPDGSGTVDLVLDAVASSAEDAGEVLGAAARQHLASADGSVFMSFPDVVRADGAA